jgi:hypothetical protein
LCAKRLTAEIDQMIGALQRAVSCVSTAVLRLPGKRHHLEAEPISFGPGGQARLVGEVDIYFLAAETWIARRDASDAPTSGIVRIVGYRYVLFNQDRREVLSFHWHPAGLSPVVTPHLHVGCRAGNTDLSKVHLPTGPITLVDVIRCAITEFGVQPLRADWRAVLDRAEQPLANRV